MLECKASACKPSIQVNCQQYESYIFSANMSLSVSQVYVIPTSSCQTHHIYVTPNKNSVPSCPLSPMEFLLQFLQPSKLFFILVF